MNNETKQLVVVIAGPTASGKTALAVNVAKAINGEVISADSMQIYRTMQIGTAKPTKEEMQGIPHHLIDFLDINENYSVAKFVADATNAIEDILKRGKIPIVCGGTGLYINSLIDNIQFIDVEVDEDLRTQLWKRADSEGIDILLDELEMFDSVTAKTLRETRNTGRIIRAIEIYKTSGITISQQREMSRSVPSPYEFLCFALNYTDRAKLYERINQRVDIMLENGLEEEAREVLQNIKTQKTAIQAIGHKELAPYIQGLCTFDDAVNHLKMETRRFAKRQITWFKRDDIFNWIYADEFTSSEKMSDLIVKEIKNSR